MAVMSCTVPITFDPWQTTTSRVFERIARRTHAEELFRFGARPLRANEPQEQFADVAAAEKGLGWRARISWETGVDELCGEGGP